MEFIQWYTSGALAPGVGLNDTEYSRHGMFRFDPIDVEIFNNFNSLQTNRALQLAIDRTKTLKEEGHIHKDTEHISHVVSEDNDIEFRTECLHYFANLLGFVYIVDITLREDKETIEDFIKRSKVEGLGVFKQSKENE